ncbi:hypothetical protein [Mesoplasma whartonense]|uniref:hypothetical protein n=1 Tax=Mesoplasma whartonense TaxID=2878854 RepID=UPI002022A946|nr:MULTISPECIES: hypothetical protein [unclassified Mesoplasma]MCL8212809.1 hypothetical protein [Mesoplasma sp. JKS002661]MCL8215810.1 hypothetical protein [Mesoplasma sp. JKS002657]
MSKYFIWTTLNKLEDEELFRKKLESTPNLKFSDKNSEVLELTTNSKKFKIKIRRISLNLKQDDGYEAMRKKLVKILEYAHCNAEKIGNEKGQEHEKEDGAAINSLYSLLTKWHYDEKIDNISILSCASDILYKLLIGHYYVNANKRTALLATIQFLQSFGFFVKFNPLKYSSNDWEPKLIKIIEIHEKETMTETEQLNRIKEWIKRHLLISYKWYNF